MAEYDNWEKRKALLYLRRSHGESGTTKKQLERVEDMIDLLEDLGHIEKMDRRIQGKSIDKKYRGEKYGKGDIYNEGEGESGFKDDRPVFNAMVKRAIDENYDILMGETLDRFARDSLVFGAVVGPYLIAGGTAYGLAEDAIMNYEEENLAKKSAAIGLMEFGGLAKRIEIEKSKRARIGRKRKTAAGVTTDIRGTAAERGFVSGGVLDWERLLAGKLNLRDAFLMMEGWPKRNGKLKNGNELDRQVGVSQGWHTNWYPRFKFYEEMGITEEWLSTIEAVVAYLKTLGKYPKSIMKTDEAKALAYATKAWLLYPAGVNLANTITFVEWPKPLDVGIAAMANAKKVASLDKWIVTQSTLAPMEQRKLHPKQTQPRTRKADKEKKRAKKRK